MRDSILQLAKQLANGLWPSPDITFYSRMFEFKSYSTNQLQLKRDTRVLSYECVHLRVPHIATRISNIIITDLQPLFITFMFPYPFSQLSAHAERC